MPWWAWAMSFPEWSCRDGDCRNTVSWADAHAVYEYGTLVGFVHPECVGD